jgi:hypothetical protein
MCVNARGRIAGQPRPGNPARGGNRHAQAALLDDDDGAALACLRQHWIATRATIAPMASELRQLSGDSQ